MVAKEITFGSLFSQTWNEYKSNFKTMFKFLFLFFAIPLILITIVDFSWIFSNSAAYEIATNPLAIEEGVKMSSAYIVTGVLLGLFYIFFYFFTTAGITGMSVQKSKYKIAEITRMAKASWLRYLGFFIVTVFFLGLLYALLIIPGIIFTIYWMFAVYIFFYEKEGILVSLKKSKQLVKGHWWKVFGYIILIILIVMVIQIILSLPTTIIQNLINSGSIINSTGYIVFTYLYQRVVGFISILMSAFSILFFKNFYFALKGKNQASPQPVA